MIGEADFEVASRKNKQKITDVLRKALDLPHAETGDTLKGTELESPNQLEGTGTGNSNDTTTSTGQTYQTYQTPQYQGQY